MIPVSLYKWNRLYLQINVYTYTCVHVTTINEKGAMDLKESKEECIGGFEEKRQEEVVVVI